MNKIFTQRGKHEIKHFFPKEPFPSSYSKIYNFTGDTDVNQPKKIIISEEMEIIALSSTDLKTVIFESFKEIKNKQQIKKQQKKMEANKVEYKSKQIKNPLEKN